MTIEGKLIVIDGGDSSGKERQSKKLVEKLESMGLPVVFLDFPQYEEFFGEIVGRYLRGDFGSVKDVHPVLSSIPYALDRSTKKDQIEDWRSRGFLVVCNRYAASNLAYMSAKLPEVEREDFIRWEEELEYKRLGVAKEDLVLFLHVPADIGQTLTYKKDEKPYMKGRGRGDIHERDLVYLRSVIDQYKWLSENRKNWAVIECMEDQTNLRSVEDIHQEIMQVLHDRGIIGDE